MKDLRKQLRSVVGELLDEAFVNAQADELKKYIDARILELETQVKKTMQEMNERHKDTMGYLVRSVSTGPRKEDLK